MTLRKNTWLMICAMGGLLGALAVGVLKTAGYDDSKSEVDQELSNAVQSRTPQTSKPRSRSSRLSDSQSSFAKDLVLDPSSPEVLISKVVNEARERLKAFEGAKHPHGLSHRERQAFHERLQSASPEERQRVIEEMREKALAVREAYENSLTEREKEERARLQKIRQLEGLFRRTRHMGWSDQLRADATELDSEILAFAASAWQADQATFDANWSTIQQKHQTLIMRAAELRQALATQ